MMGLEDAGAVAEIVASAATVVALVYLAIQIRTANLVNIAESRRAVHQMTSDISTLIGQSTENSRVFRTGIADYDSLTEDEQVQFVWMFALVVGQASESFEDMKIGVGRKDYFDSFFNSTFQMLSAPGGQAFWNLHKKNYSPTFRNFVDENILSTGRPV